MQQTYTVWSIRPPEPQFARAILDVYGSLFAALGAPPVPAIVAAVSGISPEIVTSQMLSLAFTGQLPNVCPPDTLPNERVTNVIKEVLECCTMQQCKPSLRLVRGFAPELDPRVNKAILAYCMKDAKLWNHKTKLVHKHVEYWRNHPTIRIAQTPESVATALSIPVEDVRTAFETIGYNPAGAESSRILATGEDVSGYPDEGIAEHTLQNGT